MSLSPGTRLGPYIILAPLGSGGMGEVYRARDTKLDRDVAVKVLPAALGADLERLARFEREARILAALNHPNVAQIYGIEQGAIVMELVPGRTLKGPLPLEAALNYARQIAGALEAAHEKGIIHRDLKPSNIMITPAGVIKVLDFGLAVVAQSSQQDAGDPSHSPTMTLPPTRVGMLLGTPAYMSPEQAKGLLVDRRADIWAFGAVLYEMVTGKRLFEGETASDTLAAVLTKEPDFDLAPAQVRRLLRRCLEKDSKHRLRDIGDMPFLLDDPPAEIPPAPKGSDWWKIAAVILGVTAVAMVFLSFRKSPSQPHPVSHWTTPVPAAIAREGLTLSRNGTRLAYAEQSGGTRRIFIRMMDQLEAKPIPGTEGGWRPFFSPDGQSLAYFTGNVGLLKEVPVTGGTSVTLCEAAIYGGGSWGEDGRIIFSGSKGLMRVSASGGACETLTAADWQKGEAHRWPQILPGGQSVLFSISAQGEYDRARIAILNLKSREYKVVAN
jgi:serine/threonine protein kinase